MPDIRRDGAWHSKAAVHYCQRGGASIPRVSVARSSAASRAVPEPTPSQAVEGLWRLQSAPLGSCAASKIASASSAYSPDLGIPPSRECRGERPTATTVRPRSPLAPDSATIAPRRCPASRHKPMPSEYRVRRTKDRSRFPTRALRRAGRIAGLVHRRRNRCACNLFQLGEDGLEVAHDPKVCARDRILAAICRGRGRRLRASRLEDVMQRELDDLSRPGVHTSYFFARLTTAPKGSAKPPRVFVGLPPVGYFQNIAFLLKAFGPMKVLRSMKN